MEEQELPWLVIETYFKDNPRSLVQHHLNSFNDFFGNGIQRIMKEKNPIRIMKQQDPITKEFRLKTELYFGGKMEIKYILENLLFTMMNALTLCILMKQDFEI